MTGSEKKIEARDISDAIFLSMGSNLGNRMTHLERALNELSRRGLAISACSSVYETEPVGFRDQPDFLNLACQGQTDLSPFELLDLCKGVESSMGRRPAQVDGPRLIDIDVLFYGRTVLETSTLVIPHNSYVMRRFVLVPLAELAPGLTDPRDGRTILELLAACPDRSWVRKFGRVEVNTGSSL